MFLLSNTIIHACKYKTNCLQKTIGGAYTAETLNINK